MQMKKWVSGRFGWTSSEANFRTVRPLHRPRRPPSRPYLPPPDFVSFCPRSPAMAAKVPHTRSVHQVKTKVLEINHLNRAAARALDLEWHPEEDDPDLDDDVSSYHEDEIPQTWLPASVLGRRPPIPIPSSPPKPKPATKAPRRRATRRIDDSEEERRAEEEAQEARPEGAFELLKHTLIVHLIRPAVYEEESNASLFSTFEDLLTEIDDEETRIPIGRVYLAHNDNGDIAIIANTPLHGDDRDFKASSDPNGPKVLLYLDKIGRELASPWGETSGFTMDQRSYNRPQVYVRLPRRQLAGRDSLLTRP